MLKVYTSHYRFKGPNRLDITVKNGIKEFAPTWKMVMGSKNGQVSQEEYTDEYINMMRISYRNNRETWEELLTSDEVVLVCFCPAGEFCHRVLLADILEKLGAEYLGEISK